MPLPPHDEWHRTPENKAILKRLIKKVYGDNYNYLEGHHISVVECETGDNVKEWPSVESMIFNHWFISKIKGDNNIVAFISNLAANSDSGSDRLQTLAAWLDYEEKRYGTQKTRKKVSRSTASTRRSSKK